jgi:SAM-dependent methyltransferase
MDTLLARAIDTYKPLGRWEHRWAQGKLANDPAFPAVGARIRDLNPRIMLDVGCGEGYLLAYVRAIAPQIELVGLDYDKKRLDVARRALGGKHLGGKQCVQLIEGDVRSAALPPADVVTCLDVLHYLPDEGQDAILGRLAKILRPGGTLLVRDGESGNGLRSLATLWSERVAVFLGRHRGATVNLRPRSATIATLQSQGLTVHAEDCREGTLLANVLFTATKPSA